MPNNNRSIYILSLIFTLYLPSLLWQSVPSGLVSPTSQWQRFPIQPPANSDRLIGEKSLEYVRTRDGSYYDLVPAGNDDYAWVSVNPRTLMGEISPQLPIALPPLPGDQIDGIEYVDGESRIRPKRTINFKLPIVDNARFSFDVPQPQTFNAFALLDDGSLWYIEDTTAAFSPLWMGQRLATAVPYITGALIAFFAGYRRPVTQIDSWIKRHTEWFDDNEVTRLCGVVLGGTRFAILNLFIAAPFALAVWALLYLRAML